MVRHVADYDSLVGHGDFSIGRDEAEARLGYAYRLGELRLAFVVDCRHLVCVVGVVGGCIGIFSVDNRALVDFYTVAIYVVT